MNGWSRLAQLAALAILGLAAARAEVYSVRVPGATRIESHVSPTPDWVVTVHFDPQTCQVFCEYRPKPGSSGRFLPPVVDIRAYFDGASRPIAATVDPAGAGLPKAAPNTRPETHHTLLWSRTALAVPTRAADPVGLPRPPSGIPQAAPPVSLTASLPLRI